MVIQQMHHCDSTHLETVPVHETFQGKTVWQGDVEVFTVKHPQAQRCYAWSHPEGDGDKDERFIAVLGAPPVKNALDAVRVAIVASRKLAR
jgi:hypothetical protein